MSEARCEGGPKKASRLEARHARRPTGQKTSRPEARHARRPAGQKRGMPEGMKKARKPEEGQKVWSS